MRENIDSEIELHAYVDGDLDEDTMLRVEEYLRGNPEAATRVRDYLKQKNVLRRLAQSAGPGTKPPKLDELQRRLARRLRPAGFWGWQRNLVVAAMFAAGWIGHMIIQPQFDEPRFAEVATQAHLLTTAEPAELLPISQERLDRLFTHVSAPQQIPDLDAFGYKPVGAELVPSDEGILLHIPYRNEMGTTISYFLVHDQEVAEIPRHILHRDGVTIAYWQHQNERHVVAAPLSDDEVGRIAAYVDSLGLDE